MNLQKINVKLFTDSPEPAPLEPFLGIFARWREDRDHPAGWIDMADYGHVTRGPGIMLIGKQGHLSADLADPGPGLLYANKRDLDGDSEERIGETFRRALALMTALTRDPDYPENLRPRTGFWEVSFNDRLEAPHTEDTRKALEPPVRAVADRLFGSGPWEILTQTDPARRCGFTLHSGNPAPLEDLTRRLETLPHRR